MVTSATSGKTHAPKHPSRWSVSHVKRGHPHRAFLGHLASVSNATGRIGQPRKEPTDPEAPRGLNLEETLWVLRNTPHEPYVRSPEVLAAFEQFLRQIEEEAEDESKPVIRDASTNLDKYIYG